MKTLNEIIADYINLEESIIEAGGEITPEVEKMMDWNTSELNDKLDGYAGFIAYLSGQVNYLKEQEKHYKTRRVTVENTIKRLRERIVDAMNVVGETKIKTPDHNYSLRTTESWKITEISEQDGLKLIDQDLAEIRPNISAIKKAFSDPPEYVKIIKKTSVTIR